MSYLPFVIITVALVLYLAVGLWSAKKVKSAGDFLIAGGSLSLLPLTGTYLATYFSGVSMLGFPASLYATGISYLWLPIFWAIGACLTVVVALRYRKVDMVTPADFYTIRYRSRILEQVASAGSIIALVFSLVVQYTTMGIAWSMALNRSYAEGILITSAVMAIIIVAGGLVSVAWTDVMKAVVFIIAVVASAFWVLSYAKGFNGLITRFCTVSPQHASVSKGLGGFLGVVFLFLTWTCGVATHPQYLQRISAAKDEGTGLLQIVISWPIVAVVYLSLTVLGVAAKVLVPELPSGLSRDYVVPLLMQKYAPIVFYALFLAGLIAAALSTADSVVQLCASYVTKNVVKGALKPNISPQSLLTIARCFSLFLVILIGVLALYRWAWITYISAYAWGLLAIIYFAPTIFGLYWKKANSHGAVASVVGGLAAFLVAQALSMAGGWPYKEVPPTGVGVLVGIILMVVVSALTPRSTEDELRPFFK